MKRLNTSVMAVAVVLALIAFVAPSSAYSITNNAISCADDKTTWIFTVSRNPDLDQGISHWVVFWCNEDAVKEVWVDNGIDDVKQTKGVDPGWRYMLADPTTGNQGIKIDYDFDEDDIYTQVTVRIILDGVYCGDIRDDVSYVIKYDSAEHNGFMTGPFAGGACTDPIPEFSTIAIPIASILGLLFFFNHRKRREEE